MILSSERREKLLGKADLVLSATTHRYQSWVPEGFEGSAAVCVNTGAVNFPGTMTPNGYVEIHVLKSGDVVGQYIDLTQVERRLQLSVPRIEVPNYDEFRAFSQQVEKADGQVVVLRRGRR